MPTCKIRDSVLVSRDPQEIAEEREPSQEFAGLHPQFSDQGPTGMLDDVHELEARIGSLPSEIEAGLDPKEIANMPSESLRQPSPFRCTGYCERAATIMNRCKSPVPHGTEAEA